MATLYVRDVPAGLHRRFKLLCVTRGRSIRAEVIRLIGQELAAVDDIEVALGAVNGPSAGSRANLALITQRLGGAELSTYPQARIIPSRYPTPFTAA